MLNPVVKYISYSFEVDKLFLNRGHHSNSEMLAENQRMQSWWENTILTSSQRRKREVKGKWLLFTHRRDLFWAWVCSSWDRDTLRIHHALDLKKTAVLEKLENILYSMQPQISLNSFAEKKEVLLVVVVKVMDTDGRSLDGVQMCLTAPPLGNPAWLPFTLTVPNGCLESPLKKEIHSQYQSILATLTSFCIANLGIWIS